MCNGVVHLCFAMTALGAGAPASQVHIDLGGRGNVEYVTLSGLVSRASAYDGRNVRTKGRLQIGSLRGFELKDDHTGERVTISPTADLAVEFTGSKHKLAGRLIEVAGSFTAQPHPRASFWLYEVIPERAAAGERDMLQLSDVIGSPQDYLGRAIRVVGRFRGSNLFGDLPEKTRRGAADWVLADHGAAVWIIGRPPEGKGFRLDPHDIGDTKHWLAVTGNVHERDGVVWLRASKVALSRAPDAAP